MERIGNRYPELSLSPEDFEKQVKQQLDAVSAGLSDYQSVHRQVLSGSDGEYEIDIAIRFTAIDVTYLTLVECKRYKRPIEREKVQALWTKVQALKAHKGIIYSTSGFQSGAIAFAEAHGIALIELADGRSSYFVRSAPSGDSVMSWDQVPKGIPRIVGWFVGEKTISLISTNHPERLHQFIFPVG